MRLSLTDAAQKLGVVPRTLSGWLEKAGIIPEGGDDGRERMISLDQLRAIAHLHRRPFIVSYAELTLESVAARLEVLEHNAHLLQQAVEQLGGGLAERVLRSAHAGRAGAPLAFLTDGEEYPPIKDVQLIVREAIDLVNSAAQLPLLSSGRPASLSPQAREILVISQNYASVFNLVPLLRYEWRRALENAMGRGWTIVHLMHRTEDLGRAMTLVED